MDVHEYDAHESSMQNNRQASSTTLLDAKARTYLARARLQAHFIDFQRCYDYTAKYTRYANAAGDFYTR